MFLRRWMLLLIVAVVLPSPALAEGWKAGAAREKITPQQSMWMAGYGSRNHPATGFLNDLWAKALVLEDAEGKRAAIVTLDVVGISPDVVDPIAAELAAKYQLPRANVAFCCSHTHSGPVVGHNLRSLHYDQLDEQQQKLVDDYAEAFKKQVVALVGRAIDELAPAKLAYGQGKATFAANRRNNKEGDVLKLRAEGKLVGPVRPRRAGAARDG